MTLTGYRWNGVAIRTATGKLAGDPLCCCDENPTACCCGTAVSGRVLRLTISSADCPAIDGFTVDLDPAVPTHGGCYAWAGTSANLDCPTSDFQGVFRVECTTLNATCADYKIWISWTNSDCGTGSTVTAEAVDAGCTCDPFSLAWTGLVAPHNSGPNPAPVACDCCDATDTMDITAEII